VLRRIFGTMRDEGIGKSRKLHNKELNDLYFSPNIMRVIKSRRKRWTDHIWGRGAYKGYRWALLRERSHLKDPGTNGRIILKWIFKEMEWRHGLD